MTLESMGSQEDMYLAFSARGTEYVLPLGDVGQIVAKAPENIPEIQLADCGTADACTIIFQDEDGLAALRVGDVTGLVHLPPTCQYEMPAETRTAQNRWIAGIAFIEEIGSLCFLLDCRKLRECFFRSSHE